MFASTQWSTNMCDWQHIPRRRGVPGQTPRCAVGANRDDPHIIVAVSVALNIFVRQAHRSFLSVLRFSAVNPSRRTPLRNARSGVHLADPPGQLGLLADPLT
jgi:hypothetical protein